MKLPMKFVVALAGVAALAAASVVYVVQAKAKSPERQADATVAVDSSGQVVLGEQGRLLFRNGASGPGYGNVASVPVSDPAGPRRISSLTCERFYTAANGGLCLAKEATPMAGAVARFVDAALGDVKRVDVPGIPNRAKLSPGGRMGSWTTFVTGDSYSTPGTFSTRTAINDRDAEDAAQRAVENVLKRPPGKNVDNLRAWLRRVAINSAKDLARELTARREVLDEGNQENTDPRADTRGSVQLRMDTLQLLDRTWSFLDKPSQENATLYLEVTFGHHKEAELAERLGVQPSEVRNRRWRGKRALGEAGAAAVLVTDPGEGANRCLIPSSLVGTRTGSPELLDKVRTHVKACEKCRRRRDDRKGLLRFVLAVPGLAFAGDLLHRLLPTAKHKVAAASFVTLVAVAAPYVPIPGWNDASPSSPATSAPSTPTLGPPAPLPPAVAPPPAPTNAEPTPGAPAPTSDFEAGSGPPERRG
ncbi:RNA polymerase sigma factor [Amycolatopsis sp. EV170708-02-1]|uniref:RNA polymerase sigma factor n=1 Tax=Amycolatopsis sp. EV170708-02-1 TaxID=2919322 RepID=UPI001F0C7697|nr:sigma-70 family RNA polymerase sigma factor [Amycolatopsis sp. EV170708-02-1]UMP04802.1 sigma-70 family RNA polymerase sigma factor [Amycolatopsis sp. EV170708-02-1]